MSIAAKPLSWKPVRRGSLYCAPACGSKCTRAAYEKAVQDSADLVKRLGGNKVGKGWKARVWENMGWHWEVTNGLVRISPPGHSGDWSATLMEPQKWWVHAPTLTRLLKELEDALVEERVEHLKRANEAFDGVCVVMCTRKVYRRKS